MGSTYRRGRLGLGVLTFLVLGACFSPLAPDEWRRLVGLIEIGGDMPPPAQAPDAVRVGEHFTVTVVSYGSSSCTRPDGAEVRVNGLTAVITPYDEQAIGKGRVCTDDLRPYPRDVSLSFEEAGQALIRVIGRSFDGPAEFSTTVLVER